MEQISNLTNISARYDFNQEEKEERAHLLAQSVKDKAVKESEKKTVMNQFKDEIEKLDKDIQIYSNHVNDGYMYRDFPCELFLDYEKLERVYIDKNTREEIKREPFYNSDFQKKIDFEAEEQREIERQKQIVENNEAWDGAEFDSTAPDAIDDIIEGKKKGKK